jgi:hypothetical protein
VRDTLALTEVGFALFMNLQLVRARTQKNSRNQVFHMPRELLKSSQGNGLVMGVTEIKAVVLIEQRRQVK